MYVYLDITSANQKNRFFETLFISLNDIAIVRYFCLFNSIKLQLIVLNNFIKKLIQIKKFSLFTLRLKLLK